MTSYDQPVQVMNKRSFSGASHISPFLAIIFWREHLTAPMTSYDQPVKVMSKRSFSSTRHTSALATKLLQLHTDPSVYKTTTATHEYTE